MITLYQLPPAYGRPFSVSPFCAKLELYLRLTERDFQPATANLMKAPTKTVPYVTLTDDGPLLGDTNVIIPKLEAEGRALDADLDDAQRRLSAELSKAADSVLYFGVLYSRFVDPAGWKHQAPAVKALVPWLVAPLAVPFIRSQQKKRCTQLGFVETEDTYARAVEVLDSIASTLGSRDYLLGDTPHVIDCTVWGNLVHAAMTPSDNALSQAVRAHEPVMAYLRRLTETAGLDPAWVARA